MPLGLYPFGYTLGESGRVLGKTETLVSKSKASLDPSE